MLRCPSSRLALVAVLSAASLPVTVLAQSQDSQSVAEAARRAREKKKASEKPAKVITNDTLNVNKGDVQSAAAEQLRMPGTPAAPTQPAAGAADSSAAQSTEKASKEKEIAKELAALKEQIKQAESDLDLAQREQALEQDTYFSNPDYVHDTAGKAKLEALKQQIIDKKQELDKLKARLAELQASQGSSATTPPKP